MSRHVLGSLQVAALLVSASYGIGFLFGSGEMALGHGMAGGLYGVATAAGMLVLALFAGKLWQLGLPVWDLFGRAYGAPMQRAVALLSIVWMGGVLAAQVQGGVAIAGLIGAGGPAGQAAVLLLIFAASRLDLGLASRVFAACLLASAAVLVYAVFEAGGVPRYLEAGSAFVLDLGSFSPARLVAVVVAVGVLVCTGADYHQFVLAARRPSAAVLGCVMAGVLLVAVAFLPPTLVLTLSANGGLEGLHSPKQVVPFALARSAGGLRPAAGDALLLALSAAALGSGAAILRAMAQALASAVPKWRDSGHPAYGVLALAVGALIAARGQGIVDTMVSVNVVYIASMWDPLESTCRHASLSIL